MYTRYKVFGIVSLLALAHIASAQNVGDFEALITWLIDTIINPLVPVLFGIAMIVFLWGIVKYVRGANDENARASGRTFIVFGLIGLVVMFGIWAFVNVIVGTFGYTTGVPVFTGGNPGASQRFVPNTGGVPGGQYPWGGGGYNP